MRCPQCNSLVDKVLESRQNTTGTTIRRRRECLNCGYRFTSYEKIENKPIMVIKKDGRQEKFDIAKVERGIRVCTDKLKISQTDIERLLQDIEDNVAVAAGTKREITSTSIGEEALKQLAKLNTVAYVRFASVYRAFDDLSQFISEIERINSDANQ